MGGYLAKGSIADKVECNFAVSEQNTSSRLPSKFLRYMPARIHGSICWSSCEHATLAFITVLLCERDMDKNWANASEVSDYC